MKAVYQDNYKEKRLMWLINLNNSVMEIKQSIITVIIEYLSNQNIERLYLKSTTNHCFRNFIVPIVQYLISNTNIIPTIIYSNPNKFQLEFCELNGVQLLSTIDNYKGYIIDINGNISLGNKVIATTSNEEITFLD